MKKEEKTLYDHFVIIENLFFIGFIVILISIFTQGGAFFWIQYVVGFLIMVAGVLYANKHFKCPHCGTKLSFRMKVPNYCPNCGKKLS